MGSPNVNYISQEIYRSKNWIFVQLLCVYKLIINNFKNDFDSFILILNNMFYAKYHKFDERTIIITIIVRKINTMWSYKHDAVVINH